MKNIHITMNEFNNASRILKQVNSLIDEKIFDEVFIFALGDGKSSKYERIANGITLHRFNLITRNLPKNFFFQSIKYFEFTFRIVHHSLAIKPDVVNAHSLAILPATYLLSRVFKSYLVYDTHELETERNGFNSFQKKVAKILEKHLIHKADLLLVVSDSIADWYANKYSIIKPPVVLNAPKIRNFNKNNHFREQLDIQKDQVIFLYQGRLTTGRGIELLLEAFRSRNDLDAVIVFMGYGPLQSLVEKYSREYKNIFFYPAVTPDIVLEYTSSADIGFSLIENICLSYFYCMPNKLFEYSMTGLPIIVSNMKDMSEFVIKNKMGKVINNFTIESLNSSIDNILKEDLKEISRNAYNAAVRNSWEVQETKMIKAYKLMFKKGKS